MAMIGGMIECRFIDPEISLSPRQSRAPADCFQQNNDFLHHDFKCGSSCSHHDLWISSVSNRACGRRSRRSFLAALALLLIAAGFAVAPAAAQTPEQDQQILREFTTIALGREHEPERGGRIIKWTKPVKIGITGPRREAFDPQLRLHTQHLRTITGHEMGVANAGEVDILVILVPKLDFAAIMQHAGVYRRMFDDEVAFTAYMKRIESGEFRQICLTTLRTNARTGVINGAVSFIPLDRGDKVVYQCLIEEVSQALGLPNDSDEVNPSIFNDRSPYIELTDKDILFLRILYDPRLKPGMDRGALAEVFPAALAEARRMLVHDR
jgi:hypothetical protein